MSTHTYIVRNARGFELPFEATGPCEAIAMAIEQYGIHGAYAKRVTLQ